MCGTHVCMNFHMYIDIFVCPGGHTRVRVHVKARGLCLEFSSITPYLVPEV